MVLGINTNVLSLNAQRNLGGTQSALATSLERLSTGLRINSAKDDAAGLAIAERFTTQIRGLNQAVRNASDGISLSQTAESALEEVTNNLQRIRELAIQSANATNSAGDRAALDLEVQQRIDEIDRIARQTSFNNQKVLDGTFGTAAFQIGANVGETIALTLNTGVTADALGQIASATGGAVTSAAITDNQVTIAIGTSAAVGIQGSVVGTGAGQTSDSAFAKAFAINGSGVSGLTASASNSLVDSAAFDDVTIGGSGNYTLALNGVTVYSNTTAAETVDAFTVANAANLRTAETGVSLTVDGGVITFSTSDGRNIDLQETNTGNTGDGVDTANGIQRGTISLSAAEAIQINGASQAANIGFTDGQVITVDSTTLTQVDVLDVTSSNDAIQRVDSALSAVNSLRSNFGAIQNRFESTIANLQTVSENLSASRSRIQDADFAAETAALTRAQILQQAGVSILAQANAQPQVVLGLLN
ncbi:MAG: flagellin [Pseudomonadota bacterium]